VKRLTLDHIGLLHIHPGKRLGIGPRCPSTPTETTMFTKTLLAALILATASVALTSKVNAGPTGQSQAEYNWMERASKVTDGGSL
jgi:hypothetical protein